MLKIKCLWNSFFLKKFFYVLVVAIYLRIIFIFSFPISYCKDQILSKENKFYCDNTSHDFLIERPKVKLVKNKWKEIAKNRKKLLRYDKNFLIEIDSIREKIKIKSKQEKKNCKMLFRNLKVRSLTDTSFINKTINHAASEKKTSNLFNLGILPFRLFNIPFINKTVQVDKNEKDITHFNNFFIDSSTSQSNLSYLLHSGTASVTPTYMPKYIFSYTSSSTLPPLITFSNSDFVFSSIPFSDHFSYFTTSTFSSNLSPASLSSLPDYFSFSLPPLVSYPLSSALSPSSHPSFSVSTPYPSYNFFSSHPLFSYSYFPAFPFPFSSISNFDYMLESDVKEKEERNELLEKIEETSNSEVQDLSKLTEGKTIIKRNSKNFEKEEKTQKNFESINLADEGILKKKSDFLPNELQGENEKNKREIKEEIKEEEERTFKKEKGKNVTKKTKENAIERKKESVIEETKEIKDYKQAEYDDPLMQGQLIEIRNITKLAERFIRAYDSSQYRYTLRNYVFPFADIAKAVLEGGDFPTVVPGQKYPIVNLRYDVWCNNNVMHCMELENELGRFGKFIFNEFSKLPFAKTTKRIYDLMSELHTLVFLSYTKDQFNFLNQIEFFNFLLNVLNLVDPFISFHSDTNPIWLTATNITATVRQAVLLLDQEKSLTDLKTLSREKTQAAFLCRLFHGRLPNCGILKSDHLSNFKPFPIIAQPQVGYVFDSKTGFSSYLRIEGFAWSCFVQGACINDENTLEPKNFDGIYVLSGVDKNGFPFYEAKRFFSDFPMVKVLYLWRAKIDISLKKKLTVNLSPMVRSFAMITPIAPFTTDNAFSFPHPPFAFFENLETNSVGSCNLQPPPKNSTDSIHDFPFCMSKSNQWRFAFVYEDTCNGVKQDQYCVVPAIIQIKPLKYLPKQINE